ncbi:heme ABC transporter ATP-binding protein [Aquabacter cavernae]|uniref:heme ABC transporter ATP-binding protein n=1 Tax=Aquabacter cavernae TaxID=2496029 RepID=UPI000F8E4939|nr:heme ABC transporter ATP-binding protein [Aquabacter cavernae]
MYEMRNVTVERSGRKLLSDVGLALQPGRVTVVVGPNGAGKSTLLKVLAGEMRADAGEVMLDGRPLSGFSPRALAQRRAVLAQHTEVAFAFSVAEVVSLGLSGASAAQTTRRVEELLTAVDLPGFAARRYESLSGGERQRVHLARILAQLRTGGSEAPGFMLLDEPTASLDLAHQLLVLQVARAHVATGGAVLAVLHDLNLAAMSADHLVMMKEGRVLASGPPAEVMTSALLLDAFGVPARVNAVPAGPFVLPQSVGDGVAAG